MTGAAATAAHAGRPALCARAAVSYARRGLRIHPLRPASKLPLLREWQHRATTDAATVAEWWGRWPGAGVGIATGTGSDVVVIDVDPRHGGDDSLADLDLERGPLPLTWRCLTAGGGLHLYWHHPGGHVPSRAGVWPGVDVRADGGYVVAPPTELEGGGAYHWECGHGPHKIALADMPSCLLAALRAERSGEARPPEWWRQLVAEGVARGARNDAVARLAGHLLRRGVDPYVAVELLTAWSAHRCRPPLPDAEVVRTVDSIARREAARRREAA